MEAHRAELWPSRQIPETVPKLELVDSPQETEGFSLIDLSGFEHGDIDFKPIDGRTKNGIARADLNWRYRIPDELTRDTSVLIAHGYGAKAGVYDDLADYLASHGIATATYHATLKQRMLAGLHPKHWDPARLTNQVAHGVKRAIREHPEIKVNNAPTDRFTIVGHSMGVRTAVENALRHTSDIDGIIGIDGAGITNDNFLRYVARAPRFVSQEILTGVSSGEISTDQAFKIAVGAILYVSSPIKTLAQGISIGNADIKPGLKRLRENGTWSALLVSPSDTLVPAEEAEKVAGKHTGISDVFERLPYEGLGHLGPLRQPNIYGKAILRILEHFDSQKQPSQPLQAIA